MTDAPREIALLLDPRADGAFFDAVVDIAEAELALFAPDAAPVRENWGDMRVLRARVASDALPDRLSDIARMACVHGAFEVVDGAWRPLDLDPGFTLPAGLVWGAKYAGKTNELLTQLAINVARSVAVLPNDGPVKLLDPTAGRGTTLLWAARYGWTARGIERDRKALPDFQRHVKRQTKLGRIKHKESRGFTVKKNADEVGKYLHYDFGAASARLVRGDSADATRLLGGERFHMVVGDLPYGIQHTSRSGTRNPLADLARCAPAWAAALHPGGALVLAFNAFQPKRPALVDLFTAQGLVEHPVRMPHRMSESILRELAVFTRPDQASR